LREDELVLKAIAFGSGTLVPLLTFGSMTEVFEPGSTAHVMAGFFWAKGTRWRTCRRP